MYQKYLKSIQYAHLTFLVNLELLKSGNGTSTGDEDEKAEIMKIIEDIKKGSEHISRKRKNFCKISFKCGKAY